VAAFPKPPDAEPRLVCQGEIHWLAAETTGRLVSLIVPVRNGGADLRELLPRLLSQHAPDQVEVVAVDFGSTDDTLGLLRQHRATVVFASAQPVSISLTRQLATQYARGSIFVLVPQNTRPDGGDWLANLLAPFDRYPDLAGGYFTAGASAHGQPIAVFRRTPQLLNQWGGVSRGTGADDPPAPAEAPERNGARAAGVAANGWRN
jgi:hypothetical protein